MVQRASMAIGNQVSSLSNASKVNRIRVFPILKEVLLRIANRNRPAITRSRVGEHQRARFEAKKNVSTAIQAARING
jgi:hypothetical protein